MKFALGNQLILLNIDSLPQVFVSFLQEPLQSDPAPQRSPEENAPSQADAASTSRREVAQAAYGDPKVEGVSFQSEFSVT